MSDPTVSVWRSSTTEADNVTIDFVRLGGAIAVLNICVSVPVYLCLFIINMFYPQFAFNGTAFVLGVAGLTTAIGGFLPLMSWAHKVKQGTSAQ